MTLGMSVAHIEWKGRQVNVLDTPGDGGFVGDAFIAQRVADCAILVVHAQDPIQVVTERVWRRGEKEGIPHLIVVNHLDRERTDFGAVVEQLRTRFGQAVVPLNLPIGRENDLKGVYGLLSGTAFVEGEQKQEIPEGMEDEVDAAKTQLFEAIAESDDTLLEKYLEGEEITTEEAFEGIRKGIADGLIIPVIAASAERMIGIDRLLDVVAGSAPSPDRPLALDNGGWRGGSLRPRRALRGLRVQDLRRPLRRASERLAGRERPLPLGRGANQPAHRLLREARGHLAPGWQGARLRGRGGRWGRHRRRQAKGHVDLRHALQAREADDRSSLSSCPSRRRRSRLGRRRAARRRRSSRPSGASWTRTHP